VVFTVVVYYKARWPRRKKFLVEIFKAFLSGARGFQWNLSRLFLFRCLYYASGPPLSAFQA